MTCFLVRIRISEIMYNYHMNGMDKIYLNPKQSEPGFVYHAV
jgi:hypothetical protein